MNTYEYSIAILTVCLFTVIAIGIFTIMNLEEEDEYIFQSQDMVSQPYFNETQDSLYAINEGYDIVSYTPVFCDGQITHATGQVCITTIEKKTMVNGNGLLISYDIPSFTHYYYDVTFENEEVVHVSIIEQNVLTEYI